MKYKVLVGSCDYENSGSARNQVEIEYSLVDGRFSASGSIWMRSRKDILSGGQNLDEVAELFPNDPLVQRIVTVWKKWHLNDMTAGSPKQEELLSTLTGRIDYDTAKSKLAEAGIDPDESFEVDGKPYGYGSRWLKTDLPESVVEEINSWSEDSRVSKE